MPGIWDGKRESISQHLAEPACSLIDQLIAEGDQSIEPMYHWPQTITQLDCRAENIAILGTGESAEAVIFDWQRAARGPALFDVASLIATSVEPDLQAHAPELIHQYLQNLRSMGIETPSEDRAREMVRICAIGMLLTRTGSLGLHWNEADGGTNSTDHWHFKTVVRSANLVNLLS